MISYTSVSSRKQWLYKRTGISMQSKIRKAESMLRRADSVMARLIDRHGPCTLFADNSLIRMPRFHVLVWAIINQQLSVRAARSIELKLLSLHRGDSFDQRRISELDDMQLTACGLSRQKIRYLRCLCDAVESGLLKFAEFEHMGNPVIAETLLKLPGIGPWTVDMFLMFSLGRLDVLPLGDLALRNAFAQNYPLPERPVIADYHAIADAWRPYRSISSWYLWAAVD
jgi:DNA-3-methyladenine glycosylase II